jgi:hypothetical protein
MGDENQYHASQAAKGGEPQSRAVSISDILAALRPRSAGGRALDAGPRRQERPGGREELGDNKDPNIVSFSKPLHKRPGGGCRAVIGIHNDIDNQ